jgi:hypothetical protein
MTDPTSRQRGRPNKRQDRNFKKKKISGQMSHIWAQHQYILTDRQSQCDFDFGKEQAEVLQNNENENVRYIGQGEARHRKYKWLKLSGSHVYDFSSV